MSANRVIEFQRVRTSEPGRWWLACMLLVATGAAVSGYQLLRAFLPPAPSQTSGSLPALIFGVPAAGWGLVYFAMLASLLSLARFLKPTFAAEALLAAWLLSLAGAVAGIVPTVAALSGRAAFSPAWTVVYTIDLLLAWVILRWTKRASRERARPVVDVSMRAVPAPLMNRGGLPDRLDRLLGNRDTVRYDESERRRPRGRAQMQTAEFGRPLARDGAFESAAAATRAGRKACPRSSPHRRGYP